MRVEGGIFIRGKIPYFMYVRKVQHTEVQIPLCRCYDSRMRAKCGNLSSLSKAQLLLKRQQKPRVQDLRGTARFSVIQGLLAVSPSPSPSGKITLYSISVPPLYFQLCLPLPHLHFSSLLPLCRVAFSFPLAIPSLRPN